MTTEERERIAADAVTFARRALSDAESLVKDDLDSPSDSEALRHSQGAARWGNEVQLKVEPLIQDLSGGTGTKHKFPLPQTKDSGDPDPGDPGGPEC